ncbi:hypothetical protein ABL78_8286 [Leptomonas seymouri]|uniref:Uncharacterized protein n=1 Tax=Leptomonas seymouri TaxID=5684 RepID=A0A0N1I0T1_LEPSE|nr:hypothetical protein ABL78_8286 [Leptomonas seymouri]|eukprot:KPI82701.1 hypothetical protein ABL78_8286 [Leptomonas seymouri]
MKEGSHDMNFTTRMPDRNSFVAFKRSSVTADFWSIMSNVLRVTILCSRTAGNIKPNARKAGHPIMR